MLGAPPVLILDEPTNGLDPEGIADMREFLRELPARSGATVLLSSHLLGEIEQTATHIGILSHGRLVLEGALSELKAGLATEVAIETDTPAARSRAGPRSVRGRACRRRPVARFGPEEDTRSATAALNRVLCMAGGIRVHSLVPRPALAGNPLPQRRPRHPACGVGVITEPGHAHAISPRFITALAVEAFKLRRSLPCCWPPSRTADRGVRVLQPAAMEKGAPWAMTLQSSAAIWASSCCR